MRQLSIITGERRLRAPFAISRGVRTSQPFLRVEIDEKGAVGRGETSGIEYKGQTNEVMRAAIEAIRPAIESGIGRKELLTLLPPGGARAAVDGALWDLEARQGTPAWKGAGLIGPASPLVTAFTITLGTPDAMREAARREAHRPLLKVKLGGGDGRDAERARAVREGAPDAVLTADGNEKCIERDLPALADALAEVGYALLEQPLPRGADGFLETFDAPLPLCADECLDTAEDLPKLGGRYQIGNIKLDKTGGLTAALELEAALRAAGMDVFVGCMICGSLSIAPAMLIAQRARFADLDGPLWLAEDIWPMSLDGDGRLPPPPPEVWGG